MIDATLKVALGGGLVAVLLAATVAVVRHERDIGRTQVNEQRQSAVIDQQSAVIEKNLATDAKTAKVDAHVQDQKQDLSGVVARVTAQRDGLLNTLAAVRADALSEATTRARLAEETAAAADSLGECAGRYTAVAAAHDDLAIQVSGLQALAE